MPPAGIMKLMVSEIQERKRRDGKRLVQADREEECMLRIPTLCLEEISCYSAHLICEPSPTCYDLFVPMPVRLKSFGGVYLGLRTSHLFDT